MDCKSRELFISEIVNQRIKPKRGLSTSNLVTSSTFHDEFFWTCQIIYQTTSSNACKLCVKMQDYLRHYCFLLQVYYCYSVYIYVCMYAVVLPFIGTVPHNKTERTLPYLDVLLSLPNPTVRIFKHELRSV